MTGIETTLARVLAEHDEPPGWTGNDVDRSVYECNCGDQSPALARDYIAPEDAEAAAEWHRAHVAHVLSAALRADETLVERVARNLFAEEQCDRRQVLDLEANWTGRLSDADRAEYRDLARAAVDAMLGEAS